VDRARGGVESSKGRLRDIAVVAVTDGSDLN
jgi:hypothetical protein